MFPDPLFTVGGFPVSAYRIFLLLSAGAGLGILWAAAKRAALPARFVWDTWFVSAVVACFGARVASGWLQAAAPSATTDLLGSEIATQGLASMGGVVGFLAAITWIAHIDCRVAFRAVEARDCFLPSLAGAEAVARWGCFSAGCCHGRPAFSLPWAVTFPRESGCLFPQIPVHPTQLYQSLGCLALAFLLFRRIGSNRPQPSRTSGLTLYLVGYGALRLFVDSFRGDPSPSLGGLNLNQWLSLGFLGLGIVHGFRHGIPPTTNRSQATTPRCAT